LLIKRKLQREKKAGIEIADKNPQPQLKGVLGRIQPQGVNWTEAMLAQEKTKPRGGPKREGGEKYCDR